MCVHFTYVRTYIHTKQYQLTKTDTYKQLNMYIHTPIPRIQGVCCSVLQCVLQCVAVCCSVLQCVAVCCSVLQCVAVCGSALQFVAACCNDHLRFSHHFNHIRFTLSLSVYHVYCHMYMYTCPYIYFHT